MQINLYFHIGDTVYLNNCDGNTYKIVGYLKDNEHYVLDNGMVVSYTELRRSPNFVQDPNVINRINTLFP